MRLGLGLLAMSDEQLDRQMTQMVKRTMGDELLPPVERRARIRKIRANQRALIKKMRSEQRALIKGARASQKALAQKERAEQRSLAQKKRAEQRTLREERRKIEMERAEADRWASTRNWAWDGERWIDDGPIISEEEWMMLDMMAMDDEEEWFG